MKKQFAVFGLGSFGESIALELQKLGCEVVLSLIHISEPTRP